MADAPPILSIVGKKNSGKTSLVVALAAELGRRGLQVATLKHGHHGFEIDQPGTDSWRHFNEGGAEAVVMVAADKVALVMRTAEEERPQALVDRLFSGRGYHIVLAEGYKHGPFPKIEVFRRAAGHSPVVDPMDAEAARLHLAFVTDDPQLRAVCPVIRLDLPTRGGHVPRVADMIEAWIAGQSRMQK